MAETTNDSQMASQHGEAARLGQSRPHPPGHSSLKNQTSGHS